MKPIPYIPSRRVLPGRLIDVGSAWIGLESILFSLIKDFDIKQNVALEFGVDTGYSLAALANYFGEVIGVDHCQGLGHEPDVIFPQLIEQFKAFPNVTLMCSGWEEYIKIPQADREYDLIHIDMDHDYPQTIIAGTWAVKHASVVIFHDTLSWPAGVGKACEHIADVTGLHYYNFEDCHGLGILSRKAL